MWRREKGGFKEKENKNRKIMGEGTHNERHQEKRCKENKKGKVQRRQVPKECGKKERRKDMTDGKEHKRGTKVGRL